MEGSFSALKLSTERPNLPRTMLPSSLSLPARQMEGGQGWGSGCGLYNCSLAHAAGEVVEGGQGLSNRLHACSSGPCPAALDPVLKHTIRGPRDPYRGARKTGHGCAFSQPPSPNISSFSFSRRSSTTGSSRLAALSATLLPGSSSSTCVGSKRGRVAGREEGV